MREILQSKEGCDEYHLEEFSRAPVPSSPVSKRGDAAQLVLGGE